MPTLLHPDGRIDPAAVAARAAALFATKRDFLDGYSGEPRQWWETQMRAQTAAQASKDAGHQQGVWIANHLTVEYTPAETSELARLDAYRASRPINELGNREFGEAVQAEDAIRTRARHRALFRLIAETNDNRDAMLQAAE